VEGSGRVGTTLALGAFLVVLTACWGPSVEPPRGVVLISLDTLAAGHLQCYGYARETSPNLCAFADESLLFVNAYAASTKTAESHMTLFTSLYPSVHKVHTATGETIHALDEEIVTLAEILASHGFRTAGFHGAGMVGPKFGFGRGFETYAYSKIESDRWLRWLESLGEQDRFFVFLHTYRVHDPYTPEPPYDTLFNPGYDGGILHSREQFQALAAEGGWSLRNRTFWDSVDEGDPEDLEQLVALYDGLIAQLDAELGRIFAAIDRHAPDALVIVLSDHGEEFKQHGEFRHRQTYNEVLRVPLLIRHPDIPGGARIDHEMSLIDVAPTILDLLAIPAPGQFQGTSIFEGLRPIDPDRPIFGELPTHRLQAIIRNGRKLVVDRDTVEAYDLTTDPGETRNLYEVDGGSPKLRAELAELEATLKRVVDANRTLEARYAVGKEETLDEETMDRLRQLGYVE
jgi:arylsulfatase A-like enzyme